MIYFDRKLKRYRDATGRFIKLSDARRAIEKAVATVERDMRTLGRRLGAGDVTIPEWQTQMSAMSKTLLILTVAVGFGGRARMTLSNWGQVGAKVREQNKFLNRMARQIELGTLSTVQIEYRSSLYAKTARTAYYQAEKDTQEAKLCRRVINSKEGCAECAEVAGLGFIPIDEMPGIGTQICGNFCLCEIEYRV